MDKEKTFIDPELIVRLKKINNLLIRIGKAIGDLKALGVEIKI